MTERAIEAALQAFYRDSGPFTKIAEAEIRRALAAFLDAWEPSLQAVRAAESVWGWKRGELQAAAKAEAARLRAGQR